MHLTKRIKLRRLPAQVVVQLHSSADWSVGISFRFWQHTYWFVVVEVYLLRWVFMFGIEHSSDEGE